MRFRRKRLLIIKKQHLKIIVPVLLAIIVIIIVFSIASANREKTEKQHSVETIASAGIINVGLRGDIGKLCTYDEETEKYEGLEKDITDELIQRLFGDNILVNYVEVNSETKDALLKIGDLDISLGASVSGSSSEISCTDSYYADACAFLVMEGTTTKEQGLNGGTIGVIQGSLAARENDEDETKVETYLKSHDINALVKVYASYPEAMEALQSGFVDGVCANEIFLKLYGKNGMLILPERFLPNNYCVKVSKSLGAFTYVIDDAIKQMKNDGTLSTLIDKWNLINYAALEE